MGLSTYLLKKWIHSRTHVVNPRNPLRFRNSFNEVEAVTLNSVSRPTEQPHRACGQLPLACWTTTPGPACHEVIRSRTRPGPLLPPEEQLNSQSQKDSLAPPSPAMSFAGLQAAGFLSQFLEDGHDLPIAPPNSTG